MSEIQIIDRDVLRRIPLREYSEDADKADYGKLLIVAGSRRLSGAAILSARAALRSGCGTVRVAAPESVATHIGIAVPELMVIPLPETKSGTVALSALDVIQQQYKPCDAVVIGPGLDAGDETEEFCRRVVAEAPLPTLFDATAVVALGKTQSTNFGSKNAPRITTPHLAEMSSLSGEDEEKIEANRETFAPQWAKQNNVTLVLKGRETLISAPDETTYKNTAGTRGLGTAGSGDVLTGIIGGLLAQGMEPSHAATWGVHIHALAGEAAKEDLGDDGMMARDFLEHIPGVLRYLRRVTSTQNDAKPGLRRG